MQSLDIRPRELVAELERYAPQRSRRKLARLAARFGVSAF